MNLQTKIPLQFQVSSIDYNAKIVLLGSCFSENIDRKLAYYKFQRFSNPFGILFHPLAIENLVKRSINKEYYSEETLFFHEERWHCFDTHSSLSHLNKTPLLTHINSVLDETYSQLQNASFIIITLGTSWVYKYLNSNHTVANCHKVPQKKFEKRILSVTDITDSLQRIITNIKKINQTAHILFTLSPIRHIKDGFIENQQSKAHLLTAIHQVIPTNTNTFYFPSYEIMMDELRDYRFYKEDMIHPNNLAIDYIWEKFKHVWISDSVLPIMKEVNAIQKGLEHKPFNPNSNQHQLFLRKLREKKEKLSKKFPFMEF